MALAAMGYSLIRGSSTYPAAPEALQALLDDKTVVEQTNQYIRIASMQSDGEAYMLYPHDEIAPESYAPLAKAISEHFQMDVFIVKYPFNHMLLGIGRGKQIASSHPNISSWHLMFHGNGGTLSNANLPSKASSLAFITSHPLVSLHTQVPTIVIRGSLDEVNNTASWQKKRKLFPEDSIYYEIAKGNFSYFANFGLLPQDSAGLITANEQQQLTLEYLEDFHKDFN